MAVTNNDITLKKYKKLSIQVSLSGLSFCVFDTLNHTVVTLQSIEFTRPFVLEEQLWKVFSTHSVLLESYDEVIVLHENNLNTFVPQSLFDENYLGSYLQYNVKVFETDLFAFDSLKNTEINNVYVPYININNFLLDQYKSFTYQHVASIFIDTVLDFARNNTEKQVFLYKSETNFLITIVENGKLLFFNSFEPTTPEDFIYYILFVLEQNQLNTEIVSLYLFGNITSDDNNFKIAYKYIRNCQILDLKSIAEKYRVTEKQAHQNFLLLHS